MNKWDKIKAISVFQINKTYLPSSVVPETTHISLLFPEVVLLVKSSAAKSFQSCPTLGNPLDCSPPGSSVHRIFQARVLEWGAIAFSEKAQLAE